jgi:hypothetical protein
VVRSIHANVANHYDSDEMNSLPTTAERKSNCLGILKIQDSEKPMFDLRLRLSFFQFDLENSELSHV